MSPLATCELQVFHTQSFGFGCEYPHSWLRGGATLFRPFRMHDMPSMPPNLLSDGKPIPNCMCVVMSGQKVGGQALMGGLDVLVSRNFFGAQIHSFEALLPAPACLQEPVLVDSAPTDSPPPTPAQPASAVSTPAAPSAVDSEPAASLNGDSADYRAVFIRAPAVMETGPSVEVLAEYVLSPLEREAQVRLSLRL